MKNIRTAGFWSYLIDGIKNFWNKNKDFFDDKEKYKQILTGFRKQGYNVNPKKMKMFKVADNKYISNDKNIFLIVNDSNINKNLTENKERIDKILTQLSKQYTITDDAKTAFKNQFESYWQNDLRKIDQPNVKLISVKELGE